MANTKAKGIVLEVGEPVELQQVITVTDYSQPIYEDVESIEYVYGDVQVGVEFGTTFEWVQTGFVEQLELNQPSTRFLRMSDEQGSFYYNDGTFFLATS